MLVIIILLVLSLIINVVLLKREKRLINQVRYYKDSSIQSIESEIERTNQDFIDVQKNSEDTTKVHPMNFYKDKDGQWRWRIKARNGHIIGASTQGYVRRDACEYNTLSIAASIEAHNFNSDE